MAQDAVTISYNYVLDISNKINKAIDPSHGIIDLKSAKNYVKELQNYIGASPAGGDVLFKKNTKNISFDIYRSAGIRNLTLAIILELLMENCEKPVSANIISSYCDISIFSVPVYISHLRDDLKRSGITESINMSYRMGYYVSNAMVQEINSLINEKLG